MRCYCCSGKDFSRCCAPYLLGERFADNCEALMRSRYSAYCTANIRYLIDTLHPDQRQDNDIPSMTAFAAAAHFCGLVINTVSQFSDTGYVKFVASYIDGSKRETISENAFFTRLDRWYYHSGIVAATKATKIGRNDYCHCGSGKKFKACSTHLASGHHSE